jgi:hypothetical protein
LAVCRHMHCANAARRESSAAALAQTCTNHHSSAPLLVYLICVEHARQMRRRTISPVDANRAARQPLLLASDMPGCTS